MQSSDTAIVLEPFDKLDTNIFLEISMCLQTMSQAFDPINPKDIEHILSNLSNHDNRKVSDCLSLAITEKSSKKELGNISFKNLNYENSINEISLMMMFSTQENVNVHKLSSFLKSKAYKDYSLNKFIDKCSNTCIGSSHLLGQYDFTRKSEV